MKKNKTISLILVFSSLLLLNNCYVGSLVKVKAESVDYPVSHSNSYYSKTDSLITKGHYEILDEFSFEIRNWGITPIMSVKKEEDISAQLKKIIEKNGGDAIIDLTLSVSNPAINDLMLFVKSSALFVALTTATITIADTSSDTGIAALISSVIYLFTPAAADIKIEGKVVKLLD